MADTTSEQWRTVPGHQRYMVSSEGRIRSHKTWNPTLLACGKDPAGYRRTVLDGKHYYVHRVVAMAWLGPCPDGFEVGHINHVRDDNRPENLHYVTRQENMSAVQPRTKCNAGHQVNAKNTYIVPKTGQKICRICRRNKAKRRQHGAFSCPHCGKVITQPDG